ncbi:Hsp20 family protein [Sphingomonas sp. CV7422]|uniref:Hsp20 family protein n=1 Tax=Sphingomonas sp. CV7422 TaxID=3018036 RepID=UPI0022FDEF63|nr:Hsp20 family protein [Sphingomonas sp. CV7422]
MRTNFDFTPYRRATVGYDRLFDLLETGTRGDGGDGYPPYDIVREGDDRYRITIALAGFRPDQIEIVARDNQLTVTGRHAEPDRDGSDDSGSRFLHRGIATRSFERRFQLADYVEVQSADFRDGLLSIALQRIVPDAMKPRRIAINDGAALPAAA